MTLELAIVGLQIINKLIDLEVQTVAALDEAGKRKWAEDRVERRDRLDPFKWMDRIREKANGNGQVPQAGN